MFKKATVLLGLASLSICLCLMSNTYSRYVADTTGNIEALFAKWQILVSNTDVTTSSSTDINFEPVIEENIHTAANVIAPLSKGYFDIEIDPRNVEVSFKYSIDFEIENENIPDLMITKYSIIPASYIEGDPIEIINLDENVITNSFIFDNNIELFEFEPFTIRVYFEWYEGEDELMDDEADSLIGNLAVTENNTFNINANISFEQIFE
ncbi:MAG: hypothetical protein PHW32_03085 [Bacilli bacterium]|nr:hypothetical protein [Bacilli bacterium]MDD4282593.1 hypothetical protein [Bacilli bacterium]MDD4718706.1 hypothetical protein [Bacilli bacterium]